MTKSDANIKFAIIFAVVQSRGKTTDLICISGADPEISERGGRKPNSRQGGGEFDFSVRLSVIFS